MTPTSPVRGTIAKIAFVGTNRDHSFRSVTVNTGVEPLQGYGVIQGDEGTRYFFDENCVDGEFTQIRCGDPVTFNIESGPLMRALSVKRLATAVQVSFDQRLDYEPLRGENLFQDSIMQHPQAMGDSLNQPNENARAILRQTKVEYATLAHTQAALLLTLDWETEGLTFSRKLSGVRHGFRMFGNQLSRVFAIEEHDGMADMLENHPHFAGRVEQLLAEHDVIRDAIEQLTMRLERCLPTEQSAFADLQHKIRRILITVENHTHRESELIMDAFNTDVGVGD